MIAESFLKPAPMGYPFFDIHYHTLFSRVKNAWNKTFVPFTMGCFQLPHLLSKSVFRQRTKNPLIIQKAFRK